MEIRTKIKLDKTDEQQFEGAKTAKGGSRYLQKINAEIDGDFLYLDGFSKARLSPSAKASLANLERQAAKMEALLFPTIATIFLNDNGEASVIIYLRAQKLSGLFSKEDQAEEVSEDDIPF